jgi:type IX secretion system PorP/SprF family membrane protein
MISRTKILTMKRNFTNIFLLATAILFHTTSFAQDIHFSQFTETPLYRNPALAGIANGDVRVQSAFRSQWNNIANAYKTASLNAEYKVRLGNSDDYLTTGLQLFQDKAGTSGLTTTHFLPALNYHKSISDVRNIYLSLGFMGGLVQRCFDRSKITTNSQYEGRGEGEPLANPKYAYLDGSVGMSLNANFGDKPENNLIVGAAYHHFNKPRNSFYRSADIVLNPKIVFSGGVKMGVTEITTLTLEADHVRQGKYQETIGGILYGLKIGSDYERPDYIVHGGAFMRWNDAVIPTIRIDYMPFSMALSYDVNISKLKTSSYGRGGFELSLSYIGFLDRDNSSVNAVLCPRY